MAGHGEDVAPLVESGARGTEGPASARGLHHHDRAAPARDHPVAPGEVSLVRGGAEGELRDDRPFPRDGLGERAVLGGIGPVEARAEHRDRSTLTLEGPPVGRGVDPARQARHDGGTGAGQVAAQRTGECRPQGGSGARSDDRDAALALFRRQGPAHVENGGRIVGAPQPGRVVGLVPTHDGDPRRAGPPLLRFGPSVRLATPQIAAGAARQEVAVLLQVGERLGERTPGQEVARRARSYARQEAQGQKIDGLVHHTFTIRCPRGSKG
jgi:hypothetical protein